MTSPHLALGHRILAIAGHLAEYTDASPGLTCLYMTLAHRTVAAELRKLMAAAGMEVTIDAVGNVVGRIASPNPDARTVIVGSHYDTVRDAGKYDGRLGVITAIVAAEELQRSGRRLPFHLDVFGFSEEEGVRFSRPYLGSGALAGRFDPQWLSLRDGAGLALADVIRESGGDLDAIPTLARKPSDLLAYLEVHIEQGPVLLTENLPLGAVTAIAGAARYRITVHGEAGHAGTVPLALRHDAGAAGAELILFVEQRCLRTDGMVGTVGQLALPNGAMNVIPARCELSLDLRAGNDAALEAALADIRAEIASISARRGVRFDVDEVMRAPAAVCAPHLQQLFADAIERTGHPARRLMSGAGHDAVMFNGLTEIGMLFVRCGNGGASHSPLETIDLRDADLAARVLLDVLTNLTPGPGGAA
jgi:beta-ureidopropionase / N-carbamoyl-L-amino-acid hydrolase